MSTTSTQILDFNAILQWKEPGILGGAADASTWMLNIQKYNLEPLVILESKKVLKNKTKT